MATRVPGILGGQGIWKRAVACACCDVTCVQGTNLGELLPQRCQALVDNHAAPVIASRRVASQRVRSRGWQRAREYGSHETACGRSETRLPGLPTA